MAKEERSYRWCFVAYPESLPENWKSILSDTYAKIFISPLHEFDVLEDEKGETLKKPHYHIILDFDRQKKSFSFVKEITDKLGQPIPQMVRSMRGQVRYMTHCDYPDKAQYPKEKIECLGGASIEQYFLNDYVLSKDTQTRIGKEIKAQIRKSNFFFYNEISDWCEQNNEEWYFYLDHYGRENIKCYLIARQKQLDFLSYKEGRPERANERS